MTATTTIAGPAAAGSRIRVGLAVVLTVLLVTAGFIAGRNWQQDRSTLGGWHTARASVGEHVMSVDYDGWTYGASTVVPSWIDAQGSWHDSSWPDCLTTAGEGVPVRFEASEVTVDGTTNRLIVAVDCRSEG